MDPYREEAVRLIAEGADPRQAGPAATAFFGLSRGITAREAFSVGVALGMTVVLALGAAGAWALDLRPAGGNVTATTPHPDGSEHARPTAADVSTTAIQIAAALSPIPEAQRAAALTDLARLVPVLDDPTALEILRAVRGLSDQDRTALARDGHLQAVLAWTAGLTGAQQTALLAADLKPVLADPALYTLLQALPGLDPLAARSLAALRLATYPRRQALIAYLSLLGRDDGHLERLTAALFYGSPVLSKLLDGRLSACTFADRGACR